MRSWTCWWRGVLWRLNHHWGVEGGHLMHEAVLHDPMWRFCSHCGITTFDR